MVIDVPAPPTKADLVSAMPIAVAMATQTVCLERTRVLERLATWVACSPCERFRGPAWVNDAGVACVIFVANSESLPGDVARRGQCGFLAWRWNDTPTAYFSLTVISGSEGLQRPHTRWMGPSESEVVRAIRREGWFYALIAHPSGRLSGWLRATFHDTEGAPDGTRANLERQWTFELPEVVKPPGVQAPIRAATPTLLWGEAESDFWATIGYNGPWQKDRSQIDTARGAWGTQCKLKRLGAAQLQEAFLCWREEDRQLPLTDAQGHWLADGPAGDDLRRIVTEHPSLGDWLAGHFGPEPDVARAHEAAIRTLHDAPACFDLLDMIFNSLGEHASPSVIEVFRGALVAAMLDTRVTDNGRRRPYLTFDGNRGFALRTIEVNLQAPIEDIESLWTNGLEIIDILDTGERIGPDDFPRAMSAVQEDLKDVALESGVEAAEQKIEELLVEAQVARQWSIPWGARVELKFGPFVAMRIFEKNGEFGCHFLDDHERYLHVAVGLQHTPPRAVAPSIPLLGRDGEYAWNEAAQASLKLIAAATVRDFLVVEERESVFLARPFKRRVRGRDIRTVIYLPRVRYNRIHADELPRHEVSEARARHEVSAHLRRATASPEQRFIAQRYGVHVPEGFTFVRPHQRGGAAELERIRVYRSRSASRMLFDALSTAPEGTRPRWFDFEKDCLRLLQSRGLRVVHQAANRDGDGGVDLFAVDETGQPSVAQCKCWALHRPVGPEVVRELAGAIQLADRGASQTSRGILITTSTFTDGATAAAAEFGFELIDGVAFARLLTAC